MAILASVALFLLQCGSLERNPPADPYNARREEGSTLSLRLPLPKALVRVVHRIEAMLEGPDMLPVTKELDLSPLGPATGTMGAIPPGIGRTLTLKGFDLDGNLLFEGRQSNITISIGDTTSVVINLTLVQAPIDVEPEIPDGGEPTGEPGDGEPTGEPGDGEPTGEPGDEEPTGEPGGESTG